MNKHLSCYVIKPTVCLTSCQKKKKNQKVHLPISPHFDFTNKLPWSLGCQHEHQRRGRKTQGEEILVTHRKNVYGFFKKIMAIKIKIRLRDFQGFLELKGTCPVKQLLNSSIFPVDFSPLSLANQNIIIFCLESACWCNFFC